MAVIIAIDGGVHPGPFRAGFRDMCWGMEYTEYAPNIEIKARDMLRYEDHSHEKKDAANRPH